MEEPVAPRDKIQPLLTNELTIINVGLEGFAEDMAAEGAAVIHLDWAPPAGGNVRLAELLSKLGG
ncbi:MAG: hypothetical protein HOM58_18535 [Rhodospirillaceae bacterium]|nr:hypothetical protein [Rhodospirillaceae bacterium]MBT5459315.1 hypothetical protein [Rhodospirillaceae bacterium]